MIIIITYFLFAIFYYENQSSIINVTNTLYSKQSVKERKKVNQSIDDAKSKRRLSLLWPYLIIIDIYKRNRK